MMFSKFDDFFLLDGPGLGQIAFVACVRGQIHTHQHLDDVWLGVVLEFLDPLGEVVVGVPAGEVEDYEGAGCPLVVGMGDGPEAFLAGGVPDLGLHGAAIDADGLGCELDPDGGLRLLRELVCRKSRQQVGLAYP